MGVCATPEGPGGAGRRALRSGALLLLLLFLTGFEAGAAAEDLDAWRAAVRETRALAEQEPPQALERAEALRLALAADAPPADQARILNLLARIELYLALTEAAAGHAERARELAAQAGDRNEQGEAELNRLMAFINQGQVEQTMTTASRAMALLEESDRPELVAEATLRLSQAHRRRGDLERSVSLALQTLDGARRSREPLALTYGHQGVAMSYDLSARFAEAEFHYSRMREEARAAGSRMLEAQAIIGLATTRTHRGEVAAAQELLEEAITLFRHAGAPFSMAQALFALAEVRSHHGQRTEAVALYDEVVGIHEKYANPIALWYALGGRSRNREGLGDAAGARADAERAHQIAHRLGVPAYISESARLLAALEAAAGNYRRAYELAAEAAKVQARATNESTGTATINMAERFEAESRQREIEELTRRSEQQLAEITRHRLEQQWLWTVLGGSIVLLAVTALFLLRLHRSHQVLNRLNTELQRSHGEFETQSAMLRSILDSMGEAVVVTDSRGSLLLANPAAGRLLGVAPAPPGEPAHLRLPPAADQLPLALALHGEGCDGLELFVRDPAQGEGHWLRATARPLTDRLGANRGAVAVFSDVTALREKEQQFRTLAENAPNIIMRYDRACRRIYVNPAYERETGVAADQALGFSPEHNWTRRVRTPVTDYRSKLLAVMESGERDSIVVEWEHHESGALVIQHIHIVPERGPDGTVIGALAIGHDITPLKQAERQLQESHAQLRELIALRESAREEEKKHIAREIHDDLGQLLTALKLGLSSLRMEFHATGAQLTERLKGLLGLTDQSIQVVRNVATNLRPAMLDEGIAAALEWLAREFHGSTGTPCRLELVGPLEELDEQHATTLFRVVQEALTNAARYAGARTVAVHLEYQEGMWRLELQDDGRGFDPVAVGRRHFGLLGMRERIRSIGGELSIQSAPGAGTRISALIPGRLRGAATAEGVS